MRNILLVLFLLSTFFVKASHIAGGQITYNCLGGNVYEVKLSYWWDCTGGFNPGISQTINVDGCTSALVMTVNQSTLTPGDGVFADGLCPNSGLTTCRKRIDYIGTITLPGPCNNWVFSIGSCCRGGSLTNITGGTSASYYHFASLNNTIVTCNNSPDITIGTLPNFCVNQPACFNLGVTEIDGHTLSYAFINAYQTATTFVTYAAGYTGAVPITGITINPTTGQINFTPTVQGDFVITVQITEKDALGNIIGTIMRDFQVIVTNCTNQTVACGQGGISNVTSGTVPGGSANTLQICENIPFCFDVTFSDPDVGDSIKITSPNIATTLPGSSMVLTYTPGIKNQVKATICWTPPQGSSGLNTSFVLVVKDNACPVPGTQILNYFIDVLPATSAGPDRIICGTQSASITATGSSTVFAWTNLAGTPVTVGSAFSCNPCSNPVIQPAITSTYVVTNVGGGANCKNKDTIVVNVVPDFTLTANVATSNGCLNSAVQFTSNVNPSGPGYSYTWSPSAPLTSTNTANTSATYASPGTYNYTLTAMNSQGCTKQSSNIAFTANPVVTPQFTVVPSNTVVCANGSIPLSINFGSAPPTTCGLALSGCAVSNTFQIGNGTATNGSSGYPTPYSNYYESSRMQFLYTAAELLAAGLVPGKISRLGYNVITLNSFGAALQSFSIKLKCTAANSITTFDNNGLNQVFTAGTYFPTMGWNTHNLTQAYEWDGISNILVDICYDVLPGSWISGGSTGCAYTTTSFGSVVYSNADSQNQCSATSSFPTTSSNRPNTRFGNCSSSPLPSSFTYSWSPAMGLSSASVSSPTANVSASVQYTVVVTPTAAATCSNVGTANIVVSNNTVAITPSLSSICAGQSQVLTASGTGPFAWTASSGANPPSVASITVTPTTNTTYTLISGSGICTSSAVATVSVGGSTVAITPSNTTICLGESVGLSTTGAGPFTWTASSGANPASVGNVTVTPTTSTTYTLLAGTGACTAQAVASVSVSPTLSINITPSSTIICNGQSTNLSAVGTASAGPFAWTASIGANPTPTNSVSVNPTSTTTYTVLAGTGACTAQAVATVSVSPTLTITITPSISSICNGSGTTLTAGGATSYTWIPSLTTTPTLSVSPTATTTYSIFGTDGVCVGGTTAIVNVTTITTSVSSNSSFYCIGGSPVNLTGSGATTYTWAGSSLSSTNGTSVSITPASTSIYTLTGETSGCLSTQTISISVPPLSSVTATTTNSIICTGALGSTLIGSGANTYTWSPGSMNNSTVSVNPTTTTQYTLAGQTAAGCVMVPAVVTVSVLPIINPTIIANSPTVCITSTVSLMAATGTGLTYTWQPTSAISGANNTSSVTALPPSTATVIYTVTVSNGVCSDVDTIKIQVKTPAKISNFTTLNNDTICTGGCVTFSATTTGSLPIYYNWYYESGVGTSSVGIAPEACYPSAGSYSVVATASNTCGFDTLTKTNYIHVFDYPVLIVQGDTTINIGESATVYATGGVNYNWSPNINGNTIACVSCANTIVQPTVTTNYIVVASNSPYCKVQDTVIVIVDVNCGDFFIPNVFSPNDDGLNDVINVHGRCISTFNLQIFSRWGEKVFETSSLENSWDGTFRGKKMDTGVFVYIANGVSIDGQSFKMKGNITLLR